MGAGISRSSASPWRPYARETCERFVVFGQFLCFVHVFTNHVCSVAQCLGPSMLPTFNTSGDVLISEHLSTRLGKVKLGDVVFARSPENPKLIICKRVLGLEGDRITIPPISNRGRAFHGVVPKGHVWLQGDNAYSSNDSRHYGPVPYALLQGRVFFRIWPPSGWGPV